MARSRALQRPAQRCGAGATPLAPDDATVRPPVVFWDDVAWLVGFSVLLLVYAFGLPGKAAEPEEDDAEDIDEDADEKK